MKPLLFPDDPQFWYETQRALGHSVYGGAEIGEVLAAASRITAGDYDSWHDEWYQLAESVTAVAETAADAGHFATAGAAQLRASGYYRSAEFFLHGDPSDPRIETAYRASVAAFRKAIDLLDLDITQVQIPYQGTTLHGYFYRAAGAGPRPTVVMHNGFDGTVEELYFFGAAEAVARGYHVLSFDGPGQPAALHNDGLPFRPDWEQVVTPVLDWLFETHPEVDSEKVALLGISMGGLLAPRAAAFEHRLAACIAVDGVYDLGLIATSTMPMPREAAEAALRAPQAPELDAALAELSTADPTARWAISHGMYVTGTPTPRSFLARYLDFSLAGGIAEQITCPTLVCEAEEDLFFAGQPEMLVSHLQAPATLMRFTSEEGAGAHCHSGAQRLAFGRIYDWLDDTLAAN